MLSSLCAAFALAGLTAAAAPGSTPKAGPAGAAAPAATAAAPVDTGSGDGAQPGPQASVDETLPPTTDDDEKPPAEKPGFGGSFTLDNSVPSGTFIFNNPYTFNPAWTTNFYLRPSYVFTAWGHSWKAEIWENFYVADVLDKTSVDTRRFDWSDIRLSLYDNKIYEEPHTKITLGGYLRGSIPISYASQFASRITSLAAGISLKKSLYRFNFTAGLAANKNFNRYTSAQYPCSASSIGPVAVVPGEAPDVTSTEVINGFENGICSQGNAASTVEFVNVDWALVPSGSLGYSFTDKLALTLTLYYFDEFKYPIQGQLGYNTQIRDANGNLVATNTGRADGIWGITDLTYTIDKNYSLSLGLWNAALPAGVPPKTADNRSFRFPFLDTYAFANNDWNLYFDVTASF